MGPNKYCKHAVEFWGNFLYTTLVRERQAESGG
jgi:hypothetical protein